MAERPRPRRWKLWNSGNPLSYRLCCAGKHLISAQQTANGKWFWYTMDQSPQRNTANRPANTLNDVKAEVAAFLRENMT